MAILNEFGQPIGPDIETWVPPSFPPHEPFQGSYVRLEPLVAEHAKGLLESLGPTPESLWTYMSMGPLKSEADVADAIEQMCGFVDRQPYAIEVDDKLLGFLSYLRIDPPGGVIEIGSITFAPQLQRTRAATETIYLMIDRAFELGYRRCEWKCDDLNLPSRSAAERFGFQYEGTFRKATHYKGRSRDTAWYAIVDSDWPAIKDTYIEWLAPGNFDDDGCQIRSLGEFMADNESN